MNMVAEFPVSADSPFDDGYDIAGERDALRDLIDAPDPDPAHPMWDRYVALIEREEALQRIAAHRQQRNEADSIVPDHEARAMRAIGGLVTEEVDLMSIHTKEAYRLFIGRARDTANKSYGITSGKKVAAVLRSIWNLSAHDNPYADWVLVQVSERITQLRQEIQGGSTKCEEEFAKQRQRGLTLNVLGSRAPVEVELGFRSPYGFMLADLILDYDWYSRQIKTLVQKDRIGDVEGRDTLYQMTKRIRALFESTLPYQKYLLREELAQLSRSDFLPGANAEALKRVAAAVGIFGEVPREIFTGEVRPRHSRRRTDVTAEEMALLRAVALGADAPAESDVAQEEGGLL